MISSYFKGLLTFVHMVRDNLIVEEIIVVPVFYKLQFQCL